MLFQTWYLRTLYWFHSNIHKYISGSALLVKSLTLVDINFTFSRFFVRKGQRHINPRCVVLSHSFQVCSYMIIPGPLQVLFHFSLPLFSPTFTNTLFRISFISLGILDIIMASTSTTSAATEIQILQETIETALAQKGRHYSNCLTFAWRFEADKTSADKDTAHFQTILKLLGLPEAAELVIENGDETPQDTLRGFLYDLRRERLAMTPGRCLLIGHYAGHGSVFSEEFYFTSDPSLQQRFAYAWSLELLVLPFVKFPDTDCILILDSCFSGAAKRHHSLFEPDESGGSSEPNWSAELVCSVGPAQKRRRNWSDLARGQDKTFTSRLADEVAREVERGVTTVRLTDIIANLRETSSPDRLPEYQLEAGIVGIGIPNLSRLGAPPYPRPFTPLPTLLRPSSPTPNLSVMFQIHLNRVAPEDVAIEQLITWSQNRGLDLELVGVYKSRPTTVQFRGPYQLWAQVNGLPGFSFICEILDRRNMLEDIRHHMDIRRESSWELESSWQLEPSPQLESSLESHPSWQREVLWPFESSGRIDQPLWLQGSLLRQ